MLVYFVLGPESSGTRFLTKALLLATKGYGEASIDQPMGDEDTLTFPDPLPEIIVFRRSLPHGNKWPNIKLIYSQFTEKGYQVKPIVIIRNFETTVKSQVKNKHVKTPEEARERIKKSNYIHEKLPETPIIVTYESLMVNHLRQLFFKSLGLKFPEELQVVNGNAKY